MKVSDIFEDLDKMKQQSEEMGKKIDAAKAQLKDIKDRVNRVGQDDGSRKRRRRPMRRGVSSPSSVGVMGIRS